MKEKEIKEILVEIKKKIKKGKEVGKEGPFRPHQKEKKKIPREN